MKKHREQFVLLFWLVAASFTVGILIATAAMRWELGHFALLLLNLAIPGLILACCAVVLMTMDSCPEEDERDRQLAMKMSFLCGATFWAIAGAAGAFPSYSVLLGIAGLASAICGTTAFVWAVRQSFVVPIMDYGIS